MFWRTPVVRPAYDMRGYSRCTSYVRQSCAGRKFGRSLKRVAALPCNVSLIACFQTLMFHKVVWQHAQGVVGFLVMRYCKFTRKSDTKRILKIG